MADIKSLWSGVTDATIEEFESRSGYEWIVLARLYSAKKFGGSEIDKVDLLRGVSGNMVGRMEAALSSLIKQKIVVVKPKPDAHVYRCDPHLNVFKSAESLKILKEIRSNSDLKKAIAEDRLEIRRVAPVLLKSIEQARNTQKKQKHLYDQRIECSDTKTDFVEGDYYAAIVVNTHICPITQRHLIEEYRVMTPVDLYPSEIRCVVCEHCGRMHYVNPAGAIY